MRFKKALGHQGGFTLVEVMMVILVLGVLVSLAYGSYYFSTRSSMDAACKSNLKILREAVARYNMDNEHYPDSLQDLVPAYIDSESCMDCPASGEEYEYDPSTGEVRCPHHSDF